MSKRDTQFAGFAELLFDDIPWDDINIDMERSGWEDRWMLRIAQRAYDLVEHSIYRSGLMEHDWRITTEAVFNAIPDMTTWPKEQEEEGAKGKEKES